METPRRASRRWATLATLTGTSLLASGCLLSPFNGQYIGSRGSAVTFQGCSLAPNRYISFFSDNPDGGRTIYAYKTVQSPATPTFTDNTGTEWFCWQYEITLGSNAWWSSRIGGYFARVGVTDDYSEESYWSYENPPTECTLPLGMEQRTDYPPCALRPLPGNRKYVTTTWVYGSL